jgi:hypothetical protein
MHCYTRSRFRLQENGDDNNDDQDYSKNRKDAHAYLLRAARAFVHVGALL